MITIDPSSQNIASAAKIKKANKKDINNKARFSNNIKSSENTASHNPEEVTNISPMLFLQEIDQYSEDMQNLDIFASKAFKGLKDLQLSLMQNNISSRHLHNLKDSLNRAQDKFFTPKLEALSNEIKTRIEVEIAKIEMNSKVK